MTYYLNKFKMLKICLPKVSTVFFYPFIVILNAEVDIIKFIFKLFEVVSMFAWTPSLTPVTTRPYSCIIYYTRII